MDILVEKLTKIYDKKTVLDNFSIKFEEGKVSAVMGRSGVGKTTLLNCIASLTDYSGNISGVDGVSYIFQEDRLVPHLSVYGNLEMVCTDYDRHKSSQKIREILEKVQLLDKATSLASNLSGGEKKRVALARAFLSEKSVMLLDEPLNSLDIGLKLRFNEYFLNLIKEDKKTAVFVTHDIDEALYVADSVYAIDRSGAVYSHNFAADKYERKITCEECLQVKEDLIKFLV